MIALIGKFSNGLEFERSDKYGWLAANINLIGTGMCCKIRLKLRHDTERIKNIAEESGLKINSINATQCEDGAIIELANQCVFGLTEFECIRYFYDAIKKFLEFLESVKTNDETAQELNQSDAQKLCENENDSTERKADIDGNEPQLAEDDLSKQNDDNEQKIDAELHEIGENIEKIETVDNTDIASQNSVEETLADVEENIDGKTAAADEDNAINLLEANNTNENDADNTVENEIVNEEEKMNEITEDAPNETENEASEKPNPAEDLDTKEADTPSIEV